MWFSHTLLIREHLSILRARYSRLLSLSTTTAANQRLRSSPVSNPDVLRRLRVTEMNTPPGIPGVLLADGSHSTDPAMIEQVFTTHFSSTFCSHRTVNSVFAARVRQFCGDLPSLPQNLADALMLPITLEELSTIVRRMKSGSSPGPDGLPTEFYKTFWPELGPILVKLFNRFLSTGDLPQSFRESRIVLLPKPGGNPSEPQSWRPIALLNSDYKLLTSVLVS